MSKRLLQKFSISFSHIRQILGITQKSINRRMKKKFVLVKEQSSETGNNMYEFHNYYAEKKNPVSKNAYIFILLI